MTGRPAWGEVQMLLTRELGEPLQEILPKGGLWVLKRYQPGAADPTGG